MHPHSNHTSHIRHGGHKVTSVPLLHVDFDQSSLAWDWDDEYYQNPSWYSENLTYHQCFGKAAPGAATTTTTTNSSSSFTAPTACEEGRPKQYRYMYEQPAVRRSPYYAPRLFENGVEDPHVTTWMRPAGLGPSWKHFGTLVGGLEVRWAVNACECCCLLCWEMMRVWI